jgi:hypothetical protein
MGQSVLTPEESLLGKSVDQEWLAATGFIRIGGKGIRQKFRNLFVGN